MIQKNKTAETKQGEYGNAERVRVLLLTGWIIPS